MGKSIGMMKNESVGNDNISGGAGFFLAKKCRHKVTTISWISDTKI